MKIDDLKEQKIMSTELRKLNLVIKLLTSVIILMCAMLTLQSIVIYGNVTKEAAEITKSDIQELSNEILDVKKKVHFRYFNLTHSLEDIHKVKINTKDGRLIK